MWTYSMLRPLSFAMAFNAVVRGFPCERSQTRFSTEAGKASNEGEVTSREKILPNDMMACEAEWGRRVGKKRTKMRMTQKDGSRLCKKKKDFHSATADALP